MILATRFVIRALRDALNELGAPQMWTQFQDLVRRGNKTTYQGQSVTVISSAMLPAGAPLGRVMVEIGKKVFLSIGTGQAIEWAIPDGLLDDIFGVDLNPFNNFGGGGNSMHPGVVTKEWNANGVPFVRLADGRMGAMRKDGTWRYWRPRKPIVLYASGSSDLRTLLRADKAAEKQLRTLKKAIDRRFPTRRRRRSASGHTHGDGDIIIESGAGSVAHRK